MPRASLTDPTMLRISALAARFKTARDRAEVEIRRMVEEEVASEYEAFGNEVINALNTGFSITDVARAFSGPNVTPNRTRIYEIRDEFQAREGVRNLTSRPSVFEDAPTSDDFQWREREVSTPEGTRSVYDVVKGEDVWRVYEDGIEHFGGDPVSPQRQAEIEAWMTTNPRPDEA